MKRWSFIVVMMCCAMGVSAQVDTFEVRFNLNDPKLTNKWEEYIDRLLYQDKIHRGQNLIILGYADHLGSEEDNMALSVKRATAVKEHLISSGFKAEDINLCAGNGEIAYNGTDNQGKPDDRKVLIIIDRGKSKLTAKSKTDSTGRTVTPLFDISALKEDDVVPLDRVFFESGSYEISERSYIELIKLSSFMRKNPSVHILIEGHMCCKKPMPKDVPVADTGVNSLSGKRAKAIHDYLVLNGVDTNRMTYVGYGTTRPFVKLEITSDDEAKNRRVAIRILKK